MDGEGEAMSFEEMAVALGALANPVRLALLHRLARPAFAADLAREMRMSRQGLRKHLRALEDLGLVRTLPARKRFVPAAQYVADATALFRMREDVLGLDALAQPARADTLAAPRPASAPEGAGLLLVHGDAPGTWFALDAGAEWVLGRDARADVPLAYDPFVSVRHAVLARADGAWTITDQASRNGTALNFRALPRGGKARLRGGDVLTLGRSHLLFRAGGGA